MYTNFVIGAFDTISLIMDIQEDLLFQSSKYLIGTRSLDNDLKKFELRKKGKPLGVSYCKIQEYDKNCFKISLTFSSKILGIKYFEGINYKNINKVFNNLNLLLFSKQLSIYDFLNATSIRCDYFFDLNTSQTEIDDIFTSFNYLPFSTKLQKQNFGNKSSGRSIYLQTTNKSNKITFKVYEKDKEFSLPKNRNISKIITNKIENQLRLELSFSNKTLIQNFFNISSDNEYYSLLNLLYSDVQPFYNFCKAFIDTNLVQSNFLDSKLNKNKPIEESVTNKSNPALRDHLFLLLEKYNNDTQKVKDHWLACKNSSMQTFSRRIKKEIESIYKERILEPNSFMKLVQEVCKSEYYSQFLKPLMFPHTKKLYVS